MSFGLLEQYSTLVMQAITIMPTPRCTLTARQAATTLAQTANGTFMTAIVSNFKNGSIKQDSCNSTFCCCVIQQ